MQKAVLIAEIRAYAAAIKSGDPLLLSRQERILNIRLEQLADQLPEHEPERERFPAALRPPSHAPRRPQLPS